MDASNSSSSSNNSSGFRSSIGVFSGSSVATASTVDPDALNVLRQNIDNVRYTPSCNLVTDISVSETYKLSVLQAQFAAAILEKAVDELFILGKIGNLPNVEANLEYKTLSERFCENTGENCIFDRETIEPYKVALQKQQLVKYQRDRSFAEKILRSTVADLTTGQNYNSLIKYLNLYNDQIIEENQLLEREAENKALIKDLELKLINEKEQSLLEIEQCSEKIGKLKDEYQHEVFSNRLTGKYVREWEDSKSEQNNRCLDIQEEYYLEIINNAKQDIEKEIRVDAEIESYITQSQKDYEDEILLWMDKYDEEIESRDTEIQTLKEKREDQYNRLCNLSETYHQHKKEIKDYLKVREIRRKQEELLQKRTQAATKIQAWWRGVMVRKGFWARIKKKRGKKGKNKKKGKK